MERRFRQICALTLIFLLFGCRTTRTETTLPGIFGGDPKELLKKYKKVTVKKTTREDLVESGWRFPAKNVKIVPAHQAVETLLGKDLFGKQNDGNVDGRIAELDGYELIVVTYRNITTKRDRIYFSLRRTRRFGLAVDVFIALKGDLVVYKARFIDEVDVYEVERAFAEGVVKYLLPAATGYAAAKVTD